MLVNNIFSLNFVSFPMWIGSFNFLGASCLDFSLIANDPGRERISEVATGPTWRWIGNGCIGIGVELFELWVWSGIKVN